MEIDRQKVRELRLELEAVVEQFASEQGLEAKLGSASFNTSHVTFKVTFGTEEDEAKSFARLALFMGFEEDDYGRQFEIRGKTYQIVELNTRRRTYPVTAANIETGQRFKFTAESVKDALARASI